MTQVLLSVINIKFRYPYSLTILCLGLLYTGCPTPFYDITEPEAVGYRHASFTIAKAGEMFWVWHGMRSYASQFFIIKTSVLPLVYTGARMAWYSDRQYARRPGFNSQQEQEFFSTSQHPDHLYGPFNLLTNG
jgi:hypothetical protein